MKKIDTSRDLVPKPYRPICDRIREIRENASLTTREFAEELDMSPSSVTHIETYRYLPRVPTLILISRKFKRSYSWIIDGK